MKHRQVVMAACVESHTTPRVRVRDDFVGVKVSGLGEGDELWLKTDGFNRLPLSQGLSPFPKFTASYFEIEKVAGTSPKPTSVEIHRGVE